MNIWIKSSSAAQDTTRIKLVERSLEAKEQVFTTETIKRYHAYDQWLHCELAKASRGNTTAVPKICVHSVLFTFHFCQLIWPKIGWPHGMFRTLHRRQDPRVDGRALLREEHIFGQKWQQGAWLVTISLHRQVTGTAIFRSLKNFLSTSHKSKRKIKTPWGNSFKSKMTKIALACQQMALYEVHD